MTSEQSTGPNILLRLLRTDHPERVNAALAIFGAVAGACYLGWAVVKEGLTAQWVAAFATFLGATTIPYVTNKLRQTNDPNQAKTEGVEGEAEK